MAPIPLFGLSLLVEGPDAMASLTSVGPAAVWSLVYIVVLATFFGFGACYTLLSRYDSSVVAPFSLLVPVTGLSAWLVLGERPTLVQWAGSVVAMAGVTLIVRSAGRAPASRPEREVATG